MIPLVLSSRSSDVVGVILSCGALGSLAGSAVLVIAPARRYLMRWILIANIAVSVFVLVTGLASSTSVWSACSFGAYLAGTLSSACATALMLRKTPVAIRGSVFAFNGALNGVLVCAAMLAGGYLAEHVFEPALADGGAWAGSIGAWVGTGKGRGMAFLFVACGAVGCALSLLALIPRRFRTFDELTADPDDPSADAPDGADGPERQGAPPATCPAPPLAI
jgi:diaminobutyrate-2-oxoglutarate transaminase